jgi:hypothetical protein
MGTAIAFQNGSDILVTGSFDNSLTLGLGDPNETTLEAAGVGDLFLARYDSRGNLVWAESAGGTMEDGGTAVTANSDGTSFVAGTRLGSATFALGEPDERVVKGRGVFIAKYHWEGTVIWAEDVEIENPGAVGAFGCAAIPGGGAFVCGTRGADTFVARISSIGNTSWVEYSDATSGGTGDVAYAVCTTPDGAAVATGVFDGTTTFGSGQSHQTTLAPDPPGSNANFFLVKYSSNGSLAWAKGNSGNGFSVDALPDGSVLLTGSFGGTTVFGKGDPNQTNLTSMGDRDVFVAKFNPNGTLVWVKQAGGESAETGYSIRADLDGSFYVTGEFRKEATFGPGEIGEATLEAENATVNLFLAKYQPNGSLDWVRQVKSDEAVVGRGVDVDPTGRVALTGTFFQGTATFGPGELGEVTFDSHDGSSGFAAMYWKLDPPSGVEGFHRYE